ncbi:heme oxygenase-like protein [Stemphylium lycopersici]|uniref:Heme oxygenase-like protein n=1 Tax=Stemphylium lycopersici TaxID=183478 RepID=A0A364N3M2_STELY|nr:heme oxygenase-like protein [Stemphylium lycopersici]RAR11059.1 heme oxygenase-like protein [Stemphylium lycopersici]
MPKHHPGTWVAHSKGDDVDLTDVPWAVTTHLLAINHQQLLRVTRHPFLERAAKGTLPKPLIAQWLANDRQYIQGYLSTIKNTLNLVRSTHTSTTAQGAEPDIEKRLISWLESGIKNGEREMRFFEEVAEIYNIELHPSPLQDNIKSEGLRRYEALFNSVASQQSNAFLPWLEGAILLWSTEKVYYEAWSWARRQDTQSSPRSYDSDMDGGAMRREFIPNWSNRDFMMFVEQLERIVNEGVVNAVNRDDEKWAEVKSRVDPIWRTLLEAEEAFWPDVPGSDGSLIEPGVRRGEDGKMDRTTLRSTGDDEVLNEQQGVRAGDITTLHSNEHGQVVT